MNSYEKLNGKVCNNDGYLKYLTKCRREGKRPLKHSVWKAKKVIKGVAVIATVCVIAVSAFKNVVDAKEAERAAEKARIEAFVNSKVDEMEKLSDNVEVMNRANPKAVEHIAQKVINYVNADENLELRENFVKYLLDRGYEQDGRNITSGAEFLKLFVDKVEEEYKKESKERFLYAHAIKLGVGEAIPEMIGDVINKAPKYSIARKYDPASIAIDVVSAKDQIISISCNSVNDYGINYKTIISKSLNSNIFYDAAYLANEPHLMPNNLKEMICDTSMSGVFWDGNGLSRFMNDAKILAVDMIGYGFEMETGKLISDGGDPIKESKKYYDEIRNERYKMVCEEFNIKEEKSSDELYMEQLRKNSIREEKEI